MNIYDLIAEHYSEVFPLEAEKLDFIRNLCPLPGRLCDAGCAAGDLAIGLRQQGYSVCGLDLNAKMIGIAEQKASHTFGIRTSGELTFHQADISPAFFQFRVSVITSSRYFYCRSSQL